MRTPLRWSQTLLNSTTSSSSQPSSQPFEHKLDPRHMYDSYAEIILPFGSDANLIEEYTNATGGIRTGKLMEHLDSIAGSIAYKHMLGPEVQTLGKIHERGFYIVTASVDR